MRYQLQRRFMDTQNEPWVKIYDGPSTSQYQSNGQQGLWAYRVRACKVFACSASWSSRKLPYLGHI